MGFGVSVGVGAVVGLTSGVAVSVALGFEGTTLVAFTDTVGQPAWVSTGPSSVHAKTTAVAAMRATANATVVGFMVTATAKLRLLHDLWRIKCREARRFVLLVELVELRDCHAERLLKRIVPSIRVIPPNVLQ